MPDSKNPNELNEEEQQEGQTEMEEGVTSPDSDDKELTEDERVEKLVSDRLKKMKDNIDKAYSARDAAEKRASTLEQERRDRELKDLEEAGKHKEAYELRLAEEKRLNEELRQKNLELSRDVNLNSALAGLPFRNDQARNMAYQEIVATLIQNEQGIWLHKSGASIADFTAAYAVDEGHNFLFKPKNSSGADRGNTKSTSPEKNNTSLFNMSQEEVLKLAASGKLPRR